MNRSMEKNFQKRFEDRVEIVYADKPLDTEERRFNSERLSGAVKALMTAVLKREPTPRELLGVDPIVVNK